MDTKRLQGLICAGMLSGALVLTGVANAAVVTNRLPLLGYADHNISVYRAPGGMTSAVVAAETALIQITQVRADGWAYGTYPMSNGRRASGWFRMNDVQGDVNFNNVNGKILYQQTVYRTTAMSGGNGVLPQGASVLVIAEQGGLSQIIYKQQNSMNWRIGWVLTDAVEKAQASAPVTRTQSSVKTKPATNAATNGNAQKTTTATATNGTTQTNAASTSKNTGAVKAASSAANAAKTAMQTQPHSLPVTKTAMTNAGATTTVNNPAQTTQSNTANNVTQKNTVAQNTQTKYSAQVTNSATQVQQNTNVSSNVQPKTYASKTATQSHTGFVLSGNSSVNRQLGSSAGTAVTDGVVNRYGVVVTQAPVYTNENLNTRKNNEYAQEQSIIVILEAKGNAYKITYPGTDRLKDGWVSKNNIGFYDGVNYQVWKGKMKRRTDVHHAPTLNLHPVDPEYADKDDIVTVLSDAPSSYFISYELIGGSYKARWIDKNAVERIPVDPVIVPIVRPAMIRDGWYKIASLNVLSRVLDIEGYGTQNGSNVILFDHHGENNQKFYVSNVGNGYFTLKAGHCDMYLTAANNSGDAGTNIQLAAKRNDAAQMWRLLDAGNGAYYIESKLRSELTFDCAGGGSENLTNIQLWNRGDVAWHKWKFESVSAPVLTVKTNGIKGDMNQDGRVDKDDLAIMAQIMIDKIQPTEIHKIVGDINGDGRLDIVDNSNLVLLVSRALPVNETAKRRVNTYEDAGFTQQQKGWYIAKNEKYTVMEDNGNVLHVKFKLDNGKEVSGYVSSLIREEIKSDYDDFPPETKVEACKGKVVTVDIFNGVPAVYPAKTGNYNGSAYSKTYNCAAYVKKYYIAIYGFEPNNLVPNSTPKNSRTGKYFTKITDGSVKAGDVIGMSSSFASVNGHWGIAKGVDGDQIVLIEQNKRGTYSTTAPVNRRVSISDVNIYRWID